MRILMRLKKWRDKLSIAPPIPNGDDRQNVQDMDSRRRTWRIGWIMAGGMAVAVQAQPLETGNWEAHLVSPGGQVVDAFLEVQARADTFQVTMNLLGVGPMRVTGFRQSGNLLSFTWHPGFAIECRVQEMEARKYKGGCRDHNGDIGPLIVAPPGQTLEARDFDFDKAFEVWGVSRTEYEQRRYAPASAPPEDHPVRLTEDASLPNRMIDVGGRFMNLVEGGSGDVTVVLEAGLGDDHQLWQPVQQGVARLGRVVSYDRAGLGLSDPAVAPRTPAQIAVELHDLLRAARIPPPYVLVGHAAGGLHIRSFAARYPDEVAGLVLVDATHEAQATRWKALSAASWADYVRGQQAFYALTPAPVQAEFQAVYQVLERGLLEGVPASLPEVPVVVLSALRTVAEPRWVGETAAGQQARMALHRAWVEDRPDGTHRTVPANGGYLQQEAPEQVIEAVRQVLRTIQEQHRN